MIDTHCHLTDSRLGDQIAAVLSRADAADVRQMVTISTSIADAMDCIDLCKKHAQVKCSVGVHPNYVAKEDENLLPQLRQLQANENVVAIGEIGLDYHYGREHRDRQLRFFHTQMEIAKEFNRAVVIHCREAVDDALGVLKQYPSVRCVFHCFTGTLAESKKILDQGYWLGFTGPITYKRSDELREIVRLCPMDRLLIETDSPYLSPEPMRKFKVNEPAWVSYVCQCVAMIKGMSGEQVDEITTKNARAFYGME